MLQSSAYTACSRICEPHRAVRYRVRPDPRAPQSSAYTACGRICEPHRAVRYRVRPDPRASQSSAYTTHCSVNSLIIINMANSNPISPTRLLRAPQSSALPRAAGSASPTEQCVTACSRIREPHRAVRYRVQPDPRAPQSSALPRAAGSASTNAVAFTSLQLLYD